MGCSVETLFRNYDINDIPIIVQPLKEKFDELKPMIFRISKISRFLKYVNTKRKLFLRFL